MGLIQIKLARNLTCLHLMNLNPRVTTPKSGIYFEENVINTHFIIPAVRHKHRGEILSC